MKVGWREGRTKGRERWRAGGIRKGGIGGVTGFQ